MVHVGFAFAGLGSCFLSDCAIGVDGRPEAVQVQRGSGHGVLDRSAIEQVQRHWRFRPLIENGLPTRSRALVPIHFSLAQG